jgi:hypothetical protein
MKQKPPHLLNRAAVSRQVSQVLLLSCVFAVSAAHAQRTPEPVKPSQDAETEESVAHAPPAGEQSKAWLGAQARREQASKNRPSISGPVMSRVNQRYLNSFTTRAEPTSFHDRQPISGN